MLSARTSLRQAPSRELLTSSSRSVNDGLHTCQARAAPLLSKLGPECNMMAARPLNHDHAQAFNEVRSSSPRTFLRSLGAKHLLCVRLQLIHRANMISLSLALMTLCSLVIANPLLSPSRTEGGLVRRQSRPTSYAAHTFDQPIDHFPDDSKYEPHAKGTFKQRYEDHNLQAWW